MIVHLNGAIDVHKLDTTFQADFISERHRQRHYNRGRLSLTAVIVQKPVSST